MIFLFFCIGKYIAAGIGGRLGAKTTKGAKTKANEDVMVQGAVVIDVDKSKESETVYIAKFKHCKEWVQDVKFSPPSDKLRLAVASHDNKIYIYDVPSGKLVKCEKNNSYITHFDWSKDKNDKGWAIQVNDGSYELLFYNADEGTQIHAKAVRDREWHTWTCTLGWPVQGIWSPLDDGSDINSVHRSNHSRLLVTGDDSSNVKLFRYPAVKKDSRFHSYSGHSSHVTNVKFNATDERVFSTGGNDRSIFQWKVLTSGQ